MAEEGGRSPREVSNLSWPGAPYSTAHRPVQKQARLLTGLTVSPLVGVAAADIAAALAHADVVVGHQLSSDLAVLQATGVLHRLPLACLALQQVRDAWHTRNASRAPSRSPGSADVLDTRYDADTVLTVASRRLVDVCENLALDVTQPELKGTSMTAVHRRWLDHGDVQAREKITVLNARHGLSAGLVALLATGAAAAQPVAVNQMLADTLPESISWLAHPTFTSLLDHPDPQ